MNELSYNIVYLGQYTSGPMALDYFLQRKYISPIGIPAVYRLRETVLVKIDEILILEAYE